MSGAGVGFDLIGNVAIIKLSKSTSASTIKKSAYAIMKSNPNIKGVFEKVGRTEGERRISKIVWIAGEKEHVVLHKENGCAFYVDIKKVFFTPRLSSERLRITKLVKPNETVLDMFCGIGPYSIQIAKKANKVYAIDINPYAITYLKKNILLNKTNNIIVFKGDSKRVVERLSTKFDRIIMNFPVASYSFLDPALKVAGERCVIHLYTFINVKEGYLDAVKTAKKEIIQHIPKGIVSTKINHKRAGEVAPYIVRECFDIYLRNKKAG
ncbi:MAG: methyltransferase [Candidatus Parvarchaeota archaeon]|nr:methyltransferase [Candidatus Parvarchaeota archaeon]